MKKALFVLPRVHNNILPAIDSLIELNFSVTVISVKKIPEFLHNKYDIIQIKRSLFTNILVYLTNFYRRDRNEFPGFFSPNLFQLITIFFTNKPEYLVVRDRTINSYIFLFFGFLSNSKKYIYDQYPVMKTRKKFLLFNGTPVLSPVLQIQEFTNYQLENIHYGYANDNSIWTPFVIKNDLQLKQTPVGIRFNLEFISVARFEPYKNHELLIRAFSDLVRRNGNLRLRIIGQVIDSKIYYFNYVTSLIEKLGLSNYITIETNLSYFKLNQIYAMGSVFVLTSHNDDASVALAEALSFGLPVITTKSNGTSCYIIEGYNGFVFDNGSKLDLLSKLELFLDENLSYHEMSKNAITYSMKYLSKDRLKELLSNL
jgi:glycosyltransferase involved in cell wall biosynthesis